MFLLLIFENIIADWVNTKKSTEVKRRFTMDKNAVAAKSKKDSPRDKTESL